MKTSIHYAILLGAEVLCALYLCLFRATFTQKINAIDR